ncbi:MAG: hypothetical protein NTV54_05360 [Ignavibacteriales bacterium]|nr:hypothetical protein [Ignavibacteriales bacterium]
MCTHGTSRNEFSGGGSAWEKAGYVRSMDEQFGSPTNLNTSVAIRHMITQRLFPALERSLTKQGVRFFNYTIMGSPSDTVRHSTTDINDGRQSFAILNSFSLILEGRNGGRFSAALERRVRCQHAAISAFLDWIGAHAMDVKTVVQNERRKLEENRSDVVLRMEHRYGGTLAVPVRSLKTGRDSLVNICYAPTIAPVLSVHRPSAYVIPAAQKELVSFLERHHIFFRRFTRDTAFFVESYTIDSLPSSYLEGESVSAPVVTRNSSRHIFVAGDVLVPLHQIHSTMLVIALEPQSSWGLIQYEPFNFLRQMKKEYPVYRIPG